MKHLQLVGQSFFYFYKFYNIILQQFVQPTQLWLQELLFFIDDILNHIPKANNVLIPFINEKKYSHSSALIAFASIVWFRQHCLHQNIPAFLYYVRVHSSYSRFKLQQLKKTFKPLQHILILMPT